MKGTLAICGALLVMATAGSAGAQTNTTQSTTPTGTTNQAGTTNDVSSPTGSDANNNGDVNRTMNGSAPTTGSGSSTYDNRNTTTGQSLPSTASPLPLLYVSAIGTLTTGYWLARRRRG